MDKKIVMIATLACLASAASAQDGIQPGTKTFGAFGSNTWVSGSSWTSLGIDAGYYFTKNLVGQASASWSTSSSEPISSTLFLGARYEFNVSGSLVPYLLAGFSFDDAGGSRVTTFQSGVGANFLFRRHTAIFSE